MHSYLSSKPIKKETLGRGKPFHRSINARMTSLAHLPDHHLVVRPGGERDGSLGVDANLVVLGRNLHGVVALDELASPDSCRRNGKFL